MLCECFGHFSAASGGRVFDPYAAGRAAERTDVVGVQSRFRDERRTTEFKHIVTRWVAAASRASAYDAWGACGRKLLKRSNGNLGGLRITSVGLRVAIAPAAFFGILLTSLKNFAPCAQNVEVDLAKNLPYHSTLFNASKPLIQTLVREDESIVIDA